MIVYLKVYVILYQTAKTSLQIYKVERYPIRTKQVGLLNMLPLSVPGYQQTLLYHTVKNCLPLDLKDIQKCHDTRMLRKALLPLGKRLQPLNTSEPASIAIGSAQQCDNNGPSTAENSQNVSDKNVQNENAIDTIFSAARTDFLMSLPEHERGQFSECHSPKDLLEGIKEIQTGHQDMVKSAAVRVKNFSDASEPYFYAITSLNQGSPYLAIAWGTVLLLFKVSFVAKSIEEESHDR